MNTKPIKTEEDYQAALEEVERLWDAEPNTPEGDRLEVLMVLVEAYEDEHYPIPLPDPIEAIKYYMESRGLSRQDLEPYIGTRARVSEILNRRRPLTLRMIRSLEAGLGIPPEILVQQYELVRVEREEVLEEEVEAPIVSREEASEPEQASSHLTMPRDSTKDETYMWLLGQDVYLIDLDTTNTGASRVH